MLTIESLRDLQSETPFERFLAAARDRDVLTGIRRTLQTDLSQGLSPESFSEIEIEMADRVSNLRSQPGGAQAHVVYLAKRPANASGLPLFDNDLYLSSTNRFNSSCEGGEAIVFLDEQDTATEIADRIAHQAGHLFGLRHISAAPTGELKPSCSEDVFEPVDAAVMDFDFGREVSIEYRGTCGNDGQVCDAVEPPGCEAQDARGWFDEDILGSHSPRLHLLRHVLGTPEIDISLAPGNWDQNDFEFETRIARFDLPALSFPENGLQTLYDVRVSVVESLDGVERVVSELAEIPTAEGLAGTIVMPATGYLRIVAKSTQDGTEYDLQLVEVDGNQVVGNTIGVDTSGLIQVANAALQLAVVQRTDDVPADELRLVSNVSIAAPQFPLSLSAGGIRCLVAMPGTCEPGTVLENRDLDGDGRADSRSQTPQPRYFPQGEPFASRAVKVVPESDFALGLICSLGMLVSLSKLRTKKKA